jgi:hypothetical protein
VNPIQAEAMMAQARGDGATDYEYEIVLRVVHHEEPNPDEPTLNVNTLAAVIARSAGLLLNNDITVTATSARLVKGPS